MFRHRDDRVERRMTDSDIRCTLLLAAIRGLRESEGVQSDATAHEDHPITERAGLPASPESVSR